MKNACSLPCKYMLSGIHSLDEGHSLYVNITSISGDKWRAMTSISTQLNSRSKGEGLFTNKDNSVTSSSKLQKKQHARLLPLSELLTGPFPVHLPLPSLPTPAAHTPLTHAHTQHPLLKGLISAISRVPLWGH